MTHPNQGARVVPFSAAYLLSAFGYEFLVFVLTVHIFDLTGSALNVGLFTALTFVPRIFSPYYGSLTDRHPRRTIFVASAAAMALGTLLLSAAHSIVWTYLIWFLVAILAMIVANVRTAIMTEILPRSDFLHGNSLMLVSLNVARLAAPLLGGLVAIHWNTKWVLYVTSGVYLVAAGLGLTLRLAPTVQRASRSIGQILAHMREGAAYLASNRDLRYLGTIAFLWRLCLGLQIPLFVVYVKQFLGRGSAGYGIFMTLIGCGSLLGSVLGLRLTVKLEQRSLIFWGLFAHYTTLALLGTVHHFAVALALATISFAVFYAAVVSLHSLRDRSIPVDFRGRVYGCITGILTPAAVVSILIGSYLAGILGVESVLFGGGLLAAISLVFVQIHVGAIPRIGKIAPAMSDQPGVKVKSH